MGEMAENGPKMAENGPKMAENGWGGRMAKNSRKWTKNGPKISQKMARKWRKVSGTENGQKWQKKAENGRK